MKADIEIKKKTKPNKPNFEYMNFYVNVNNSLCRILYTVVPSFPSLPQKIMMEFDQSSSSFHSPLASYLWLCVLTRFARPALEFLQTHSELVQGMK